MVFLAPKLHQVLSPVYIVEVRSVLRKFYFGYSVAYKLYHMFRHKSEIEYSSLRLENLLCLKDCFSQLVSVVTARFGQRREHKVKLLIKLKVTDARYAHIVAYNLKAELIDVSPHIKRRE